MDTGEKVTTTSESSGSTSNSVSVPCHDTSEAVELCQQYGLYLKPTAKMNITVQLPVIRQTGKTISNWEVMEKLRAMIRPEEFLHIKIIKSTLEFIRFECELEARSLLGKVRLKLDNQVIKLTGFADSLKIRAAEAKIAYPTRHDWDSFFRDAKDMNEMRAGERPDTVHVQGLPNRWFSQINYNRDSTSVAAVVPLNSDINVMTSSIATSVTEMSTPVTAATSSAYLRPSETILKEVFSVFGEIRCLDVPQLDPCQAASQSKFNTFHFGSDLLFDAYIQYKEYISFVKAMDALRGMKLMFYDSIKKVAFTTSVKVDFDRTKHLSDKEVKKRLVAKENFEKQRFQQRAVEEEAKRRCELEDSKQKTRIKEVSCNVSF